MGKKLIDNFKSMSKVQRGECIAACVLTAALLVALPVYAWFANSRNLETMTKIQEPGDILIRAGHADPIVNFEMKDIDIEEIAEGKPKDIVFTVVPGDYSMSYDLQLAHTTNIPFHYEIYRASEVQVDGEPDDDLVVYHPRNNSDEKTYYEKGDLITFTKLNYDNGHTGREIALSNDECYELTYDDDDDIPEIYAIPVYSQTVEPIRHSNELNGDYDFFILELSWEEIGEEPENSPYAEWNTAANNKETDIIYITAKKHTG